MIFFAILLGVTGFCLSAFFSGTETGFYRISRIRVQLDAIAGHRISQLVLWLINRPSFFIATILIGNNIANYCASTASVLFVQQFFVSSGCSAEILATIVMTPFLFVYGEMFPKYVFMQIPGKMLTRCMPLFFFFLILLMPITVVIWLLNRFMAILLKEKTETWEMHLARRELAKRFDEGEEFGLIFPAQKTLTQNVFAFSSKSISDVMVPFSKYPRILQNMTAKEMLAIAQKNRLSEFPVHNPLLPDQPVGYLRTLELELVIRKSTAETSTNNHSTMAIELPLRELIELDQNYSLVNALLLFQSSGESFALVIDDDDRMLGLISEKQLMQVMFSNTRTDTATQEKSCS